MGGLRALGAGVAGVIHGDRVRLPQATKRPLGAADCQDSERPGGFEPQLCMLPMPPRPGGVELQIRPPQAGVLGCGMTQGVCEGAGGGDRWTPASLGVGPTQPRSSWGPRPPPPTLSPRTPGSSSGAPRGRGKSKVTAAWGEFQRWLDLGLKAEKWDAPCAFLPRKLQPLRHPTFPRVAVGGGDQGAEQEG